MVKMRCRRQGWDWVQTHAGRAYLPGEGVPEFQKAHSAVEGIVLVTRSSEGTLSRQCAAFINQVPKATGVSVCNTSLNDSNVIPVSIPVLLLLLKYL